MNAVDHLRQFTARALDDRTLRFLNEQVVQCRELYFSMIRDMEDIPVARDYFIERWSDRVRAWDWALATIQGELRRRSVAADAKAVRETLKFGADT